MVNMEEEEERDVAREGEGPENMRGRKRTRNRERLVGRKVGEKKDGREDKGTGPEKMERKWMKDLTRKRPHHTTIILHLCPNHHHHH